EVGHVFVVGLRDERLQPIVAIEVVGQPQQIFHTTVDAGRYHDAATEPARRLRDSGRTLFGHLVSFLAMRSRRSPMWRSRPASVAISLMAKRFSTFIISRTCESESQPSTSSAVVVASMMRPGAKKVVRTTSCNAGRI